IADETLECITEHERILQEIESTDTACVGPTLRSIYDDQPNAHKRFMEKLDARIRNHDREIEKMCNFHHQGFVDAITELLKVRADAEKLMVREITGCVNSCIVKKRKLQQVFWDYW
uniref:Exocyst complex component EXOC6/Sec15 N-terminal domain-containing protein n=1 Tax=Haplochromis burtoni TaxID=8153 RepID=A0A3Q2VSN4_HAPBU